MTLQSVKGNRQCCTLFPVGSRESRLTQQIDSAVMSAQCHVYFRPRLIIPDQDAGARGRWNATRGLCVCPHAPPHAARRQLHARCLAPSLEGSMLNCFEREATVGIWDLGTLAAARAAPLLQRIGHLGWLLLSFPQCDRVLKTILGSSGTVAQDTMQYRICKLDVLCVPNTRLHNGFPAIHARPFRPSGQ